MVAVVQTEYGSADVLELREVVKSEPGDGEVLVRVIAASIAAGDCFGMRGTPFPARLVIGFPKPKKDYIVGLDFAGIVESTGKDIKGFQPGQKVLINGASGGVGPFAVQIAKALGAEVSAVCSTGNVQMAFSIGADHVIDYTRDDFTRGEPCYDLILDNAASHFLSDTRRVLTPHCRPSRVSPSRLSLVPHFFLQIIALKRATGT
jgi:NADPH:quinone reductase-like Zn-dependent oxidoreductase